MGKEIETIIFREHLKDLSEMESRLKDGWTLNSSEVEDERQHRWEAGNESNLIAPDKRGALASTTHLFTPLCNLYSEFPSF